VTEAKKRLKRSRRREEERERKLLREKRKLKRKHDEEIHKQQQEVIKARAVIAGPVQVGQIDLGSKKPCYYAGRSRRSRGCQTEAVKLKLLN
jgi:translation initiation factor IF-2